MMTMKPLKQMNMSKRIIFCNDGVNGHITEHEKNRDTVIKKWVHDFFDTLRRQNEAVPQKNHENSDETQDVEAKDAVFRDFHVEKTT